MYEAWGDSLIHSKRFGLWKIARGCSAILSLMHEASSFLVATHDHIIATSPQPSAFVLAEEEMCANWALQLLSDAHRACRKETARSQSAGHCGVRVAVLKPALWLMSKVCVCGLCVLRVWMLTISPLAAGKDWTAVMKACKDAALIYL